MVGTFSQLLKQIRTNSKLNQKQVGQLLDVSQGMVSVIEGGQQQPSRELAEKIRELAAKFQTPTPTAEKQIDLKKHLRAWKKEGFEFSLLEIPYQERSGDFFIDTTRGNKSLMLIGDSFGHGDQASYMSHAMTFGFNCIRKTINAELITPESIITVLKGAYQASQNLWPGPPSVMSIQIDLSSGELELANDGMPLVLVQNKEGNDITASEKVHISIPYGGTVLAFSDGFVDMFEHPTKMKDKFQKVSKSFKGDAQAIMLNILKASKISSVEPTKLRDDVTALVIARARSSD